MLNNRLAVGTVQFGLNYGVVNQEGQVSVDSGRKILDYARISGLDTLDTAVKYGNSEERLGNIQVDGWKIISKLPGIPKDCSDVTDWVYKTVKNSLARIGVPKLYGLLLHYPNQLFDETGDQLYLALSQLVTEGLVDKIGISIYSPDELTIVLNKFQFDLVQAPFNPIDHRLITSGWLKYFEENNVELHVRSIFLQGLLVTHPSELPRKFLRWKIFLERWYQ